MEKGKSTVKYQNTLAEKIDSEDILVIQRKGYFGGPLKEGCYAVYLGPSDRGFIVLKPTDKNLIGVPKEEKERWAEGEFVSRIESLPVGLSFDDFKALFYETAKDNFSQLGVSSLFYVEGDRPYLRMETAQGEALFEPLFLDDYWAVYETSEPLHDTEMEP